MTDEIGEPEQPLDVDGIRHLASSQGTEFWLRELCMQIAALRETIQNKRRFGVQVNRGMTQKGQMACMLDCAGFLSTEQLPVFIERLFSKDVMASIGYDEDEARDILSDVLIKITGALSSNQKLNLIEEWKPQLAWKDKRDLITSLWEDFWDEQTPSS